MPISEISIKGKHNNTKLNGGGLTATILNIRKENICQSFHDFKRGTPT